LTKLVKTEVKLHTCPKPVPVTSLKDLLFFLAK